MSRLTAFLKAKGKPNPPRGPSGKARRPRSLFRRGLHWVRMAALVFFLASMASVILFAFVPPPLTPLMAIRCVEQLTGEEDLRLSKDWVAFERISPHLVDAVIAAEDQQFLEHKGFDFESIRSAFLINLGGKRKLGASTISQQTAKNLFLWPARSWLRKGLEAYFTFLMEVFWSKRRILTVYLNVIETGPGIYGVEAAAREYFGVSARDVGREQAALLAATLPNPRRWSPDRPTAYLHRRQAWILRQMDMRGSLSLSRELSKERRLLKNILGLIFK